jgi:hypothetical protein
MDERTHIQLAAGAGNYAGARLWIGMWLVIAYEPRWMDMGKKAGYRNAG